jgi:hypothetical protein
MMKLLGYSTLRKLRNVTTRRVYEAQTNMDAISSAPLSRGDTMLEE